VAYGAENLFMKTLQKLTVIIIIIIIIFHMNCSRKNQHKGVVQYMAGEGNGSDLWTCVNILKELSGNDVDCR
jgi:hypothetical protein